MLRPSDDLLLVSAEGQSIRFTATDEALRPMGRATSGVLGMRFNSGDRLLSLAVVRPDMFLLVATAGGYAKRTPIEDYPVQGRGGKGVLTLQYDRRRGTLVGALIVGLDDELYAITSTGGVIRTSAREVRKAGRQTKGVRLMNLGESSTLLAVARNAEDDAVDTDADPDELTRARTPASDQESSTREQTNRTGPTGRGSARPGGHPPRPTAARRPNQRTVSSRRARGRRVADTAADAAGGPRGSWRRRAGGRRRLDREPTGAPTVSDNAAPIRHRLGAPGCAPDGDEPPRARRVGHRARVPRPVAPAVERLSVTSADDPEPSGPTPASRRLR